MRGHKVKLHPFLNSEICKKCWPRPAHTQPNVHGLRQRSKHEALLFQDSLKHVNINVRYDCATQARDPSVLSSPGWEGGLDSPLNQWFLKNQSPAMEVSGKWDWTPGAKD